MTRGFLGGALLLAIAGCDLWQEYEFCDTDADCGAGRSCDPDEYVCTTRSAGDGDGDAPGDGDGDGDGDADAGPGPDDQPGSCADPFEIEGPAADVGADTTNAAYQSSVTLSAEQSCTWSATAAPDAVYRFELAPGEVLVAELEATYDTALLISTDCAVSEGACRAGADAPGASGERLVVPNPGLEPVTYFVIVDGKTAEDIGSFTLHVETEEISVLVAPDCNDLEIEGRGPVDCSALVSAAGFCDAVFADEIAPDLELLFACGACDPGFLEPPPDAEGLCLPDPVPVPSTPTESTGCVGCHAPLGYGGTPGIEDPHPTQPIECAACHGGDPLGTSMATAHVCPPVEIGDRAKQILDPRAYFLRTSLVGVETLEPYECPGEAGPRVMTPYDWLAFVAPGDLRAGSVGLGCGACHGATAVNAETGEEFIAGGDVVTKASRSVMATAAGIHGNTRHGAGIDNAFSSRRTSVPETDFATIGDLAAIDVADADYYGPNRNTGQVDTLVAATSSAIATGAEQAPSADLMLTQQEAEASNYPNGLASAEGAALFQDVINQACAVCHLSGRAGAHQAGRYRSTGCAGCHYATGIVGRSQSHDAAIPKLEPFDPDFLTPGEHSHRVDHRMRSQARVPGALAGGTSRAIEGADDMRCAACHTGTNQTVAQYQGARLDPGSVTLGHEDSGNLAAGEFYPSTEPVTHGYRASLFGENATYAGAAMSRWIDTEIWQLDTAEASAAFDQEQTPADVHHEGGLGCIDCHGTGALHGDGGLYTQMRSAAHFEGAVRCETCHGTVDGYAISDGTNLLDEANRPLTNTVAQTEVEGEFFLISRLTGKRHYIVQVRDLVDGAALGGFGKEYPDGSPRAGQGIANGVASYAMGRIEATQDLANGFGPLQPTNPALAGDLTEGFSHLGGTDGVGGLECVACHAAWQNNCIGCHMEARYDDGPGTYYFGAADGERVRLNLTATGSFANPVQLFLGIGPRGKIAPFTGISRFFRYVDPAGAATPWTAFSDRNGLGNDPALRLLSRSDTPALSKQPFTPHATRGRATPQSVGARGCLDCHLASANELSVWDQTNTDYDISDVVSNGYADAIAFNVNMTWGRAPGPGALDANGHPVALGGGETVYETDQAVQPTGGVTNISSNHTYLEATDTLLPEYVQQVADTNAATVTRPLPSDVLARLDAIDTLYGGLGDIYARNPTPGSSPAETGDVVYFLNDYRYIGQTAE